ncbi:MAG: hypothetical protein ACLQQ4_13810 [Bacteroidia bacterium]
MKRIIYTITLLYIGGILNPMKAQFIIPIIPVPVTQPVQAVTIQPPSPTGYLEVGFGMAMPVGRFANETGTGYGGYAELGNNFSISLAIPIKESNFGFALMYGSFWNYFDMNSYISNIEASDPGKFYSAINQDEYDETVLTGGFFATYPLHRLSLDFRLMGGVAFCYLPGVNYGANPNMDGYYTYEWNTYSSHSTSFAWDIGGDLRYRIRMMSLMLGIDLMKANPIINTTQQYNDLGGSNYYTHLSGNIPVSLISLNFGIAYRIK